MNWPLLDTWLRYAPANVPAFALQALLFVVAFTLVFLVLFTTRDIILRTHSFLFQMFAIILVAILPFVGFCIYLLIRPGKTLYEKKVLHLLHEIAGLMQEKKQKIKTLGK